LLTVVSALIEPGAFHSTAGVLEDGRRMASIGAPGGVGGVLVLIEALSVLFEVDEWRVELSGFQRVVLVSPAVRALCERLSITLEPVGPVA
jgi:hypothetical protein